MSCSDGDTGTPNEAMSNAIQDATARFRETVGELSLLREISDCGAYLDDREAMAQAMVGSIQTEIPVDACALFAPADENGWRYLAGVSLNPDAIPPDAVATGLLDMADNAADHVAMTGAGNKNPAGGIGAQIAISLCQGGRRAGVLVLTDPDAATLWTQRKPLFSIITGMLANLLETARMYGKMEDTNRYLEATLVKRTEALKATQEQLHQKEKLASLGQLVTGVSHELNNRLVPILGYAQLLKGEPLDEAIAGPIQAIETAALGSKRIVDDLLCFAHPSPPVLAPTDLAQLIGDVVQSVQIGQGSDTPITTHCTTGVAFANVDRRQVEQVLHNLVKNALHAVDNTKDGHVRVDLTLMEGQAILAVEDNGIGISDELQKRIFEPFFTTKGVGKGTGLGLSLGYGLTRSNGGTMKVESREGVGSRFTVNFPTCQDVQSDSDGVSPTGEVKPQEVNSLLEVSNTTSDSKKRILIVEDEPGIREFLVQVLGQQFQVSSAQDGVDAQSFLAKEGFDVVLMDLRMPRQGGVELYHWLDEHRPETAAKVVFMTGDLYDQEANAFLDRRHNAHLLKPFTLKELEQAICSVPG